MLFLTMFFIFIAINRQILSKKIAFKIKKNVKITLFSIKYSQIYRLLAVGCISEA